jgi:uncharacterized protein (DUF302 family)
VTDAQSDIVTKDSAESVRDALARLLGLITSRGMKVFAVIDQQEEARQEGLRLRETVLVLFGSPVAGTPIMVESPLAALDLPLKVLVWADDQQTKPSYYAPTRIAQRHHFRPDLAAAIAGIDALTDTAVSR